MSSRPLRIMHVFGGLVRSGVESVVLTLAKLQVENGDDVILVPLANGSFSTEARDLGFEVDPLGKTRRRDLLSIPRLARLIRKHEVDIVHSHAVYGAFYACPAGRLAGVRFQVNHFHAETKEHLADQFRWEWPRLLAYKYHLWLTRYCQRLITVNELLRQNLIRDGVPRHKIACVPNAVDFEAVTRFGAARESIRTDLGFPAGTTVIGTAGRLAPVKNLSMLLQAARRLMDAGKDDVRVLIVGDGPDRTMLENMANDLGVASRVQFTGWRDDATRVLLAMDIFVMTSTTEGLPIAALEAMAQGKPVVATDVGGLHEVVRQGETGLLVRLDDVDELTAALLTLSFDKDRARQFGQAGRALVQQEFTADAVFRKVHRVYTEMLTAGEP